ncbi:MAG: helix-turn-helix domain-containing protein [Eubacteriales bacterium]
MTDLLTVFEVADYLRTTPTTIYRWLKQGKIRGIKIGKEWRIYESSLSDLTHINTNMKVNDHLWTRLNKSEHLLVITNCEEDIYKLETSFFKHAMNQGKRMLKGCWWQDMDQIREKYNSNGIDIEYLESKGLFTLVDFDAQYKKYGINGPVYSWITEIEKNKNDVLWASGSPEMKCCGYDEAELIRFETKLNNTIQKMPVVGICPYVIKEFSEDSFNTIVSLMQQHSGTVFFSRDNNTTLLRN